MQRNAKSYVEEALEDYFQPLIKDVDTFEEQLVTRENNLIQSLDKVKSMYKDYSASRLIDHTFVALVLCSTLVLVDYHFKKVI